MWNLKYDANELIYKTETDSQTQKTDLLSVAKGKKDGKGQSGTCDQHMQTVMY